MNSILEECDLYRTRGKNLISRGGRINATNYLINWTCIMLLNWAVSTSLAVLITPLNSFRNNAGLSHDSSMVPFYFVSGLAFVLLVNNGLKRFRDSHESSIPEWTVIVGHLIPVLCWITYVYLLVVPSKAGRGISRSDIASTADRLMERARDLLKK